jgi:hypothetical protein
MGETPRSWDFLANADVFVTELGVNAATSGPITLTLTREPGPTSPNCGYVVGLRLGFRRSRGPSGAHVGSHVSGNRVGRYVQRVAMVSVQQHAAGCL